MRVRILLAGAVLAATAAPLGGTANATILCLTPEVCEVVRIACQKHDAIHRLCTVT